MKSDKQKRALRASVTPRGMVLTVLGAVTLAVAILSMYVSYTILNPRFGAWALPTVGALDALWVVFQATEILSRNNKSRARRVQWAGLALTAVNAGIPTADLVMSGHGRVDLAVILTPIAIIATKTAWWIVLPSLGRQVSAGTRQRIAVRRQQVADRLEEMEAAASDRIEFLELSTELEERVAEAETKYRKSQLKTQQTMAEKLHGQAEATAKTVANMPLPAEVAAISLPELDTWMPTAPALPVGRAGSGTAESGRHTAVTQASALPQETGTFPGTAGVPGPGSPAHQAAQASTLAELAAVAGVPVPVPGEQLSNEQVAVVLRHLRYSDDPPQSYRSARKAYGRLGYVCGEERCRHVWAALLANEDSDASAASEDAESDDEPEDAAV